MDKCAFSRSVVARSEVSVSMCSFCFSSHEQHEASMQLKAMSTQGTAHFASQICCFREVLSSKHEIRVLVTRSEVLRHAWGSIDIYAVHCPRGQVFHVASLNRLFHGCVTARCLFVLSRTGWQRVLRSRHRNRKMMTQSSSRCT